MLQHRIEISQCPITDKHLNMLGEFPGQVAGRNTANRATIASDRALHLQLVHYELEHALGIKPLLVRVEAR